MVADSGKKGVPISDEDFEYLKAVGELIGAAVGKAKLVEELVESYRKREAVVRETTHTFRNSISIIGGFSRRIARPATDAGLAVESTSLPEKSRSWKHTSRSLRNTWKWNDRRI